MKTKKILFAVLTVALATAFIAGCINPLDETSPGVINKSAPEGKTLVSISLGDSKSSERTIVPSTTAYGSDPTTFTHFLLTVYDTDLEEFVTLDAPFNAIFVLATVYNGLTWDFSVPLEPNKEYEFTLLAFDSAGPGTTTNPVAWGNATKLIDEDSLGNDSVSIVLHEIFEDVEDSGYKGSFSWNLTGSLAAYTTAVLKLALVSTPGTYVVNTSLKTTPSSTQVNLTPGKYKMTIELGNPGYQSKIVQEIVYIYSGFTTQLNTTTLVQGLPALRKNLYKVTFDYGDDDQGIGEDRPADLDVIFGSVIKTAIETLFTDFNADNLINSNLPVCSTTGYHFDGWLYDDEYGDPLGSAEKMIKDITLYATWAEDEISEVDLGGPTVVWGTLGSVGSASFTGTKAVWNNTTLTLELTLKVVVNGGAYLGPFSWTDDSGDEISTSDDDVLNLSWADGDTGWFMPGTYTLTLFVEGGSFATTFTNPYPASTPP